MIAGLETITAGDVAIGGRVVNDVEPEDRDIAMVFQNYALYPHMTVYDNMAYGLRIRGMPKAEIERACSEAARILELDAAAERKPRAAVRRPAPARRDGPRDRARARRCSCSTSRCRTSTPSCACRCASRSSACTRRSAPDRDDLAAVDADVLEGGSSNVRRLKRSSDGCACACGPLHAIAKRAATPAALQPAACRPRAVAAFPAMWLSYI